MTTPNEAPEFEVELSQNKYLARGDETMHVIVTVRAVGGRPPAEAAEVLLVDCSASMDWPPTKLAAARQATAVAIDTLRDGVHFGVVSGTSRASMVYPEHGLVRATEQTRAAAKAALHGLIAGGGTAMSTWLTLAAELFEPYPDAVRHAILLTDGKNESEPPERLGQALAACEGRFDCDARGIGDDWRPAELQRICGTLHGQADAVLAESELAADFGQLIAAAMGRVIPELRLHLTTMPYTALRFAKQVYPAKADLTTLLRPIGAHAFALPTGGWGAEQREYHLCFEVDTAELTLGQDRLLGRIGADGTAAGGAVLGHLTEDFARSSRVDERVSRHTQQADLRTLIDLGWRAHDTGALPEAIRRWGEALRLAGELGDENLITRLRRLIVEDGHGGFRLKPGVRPRDVHSVLVGAGRSMASMASVNSVDSVDSGTSPASQPESAPDGAAEKAVRCAQCRRQLRARAKVCGRCGTPVDAAGVDAAG